MSCRGGELSGNEIDILTSNDEICRHLKRNWEYYCDWADRAIEFGIDNQGMSLQGEDVIRFIESAILATAAKTQLNATIRTSTIDKDHVVYLLARAVYKSPKECSQEMLILLRSCREE